MSSRYFSVNLSVLCDTPEQVATAMEVLGRSAAGIALEGRTVNVSVVSVDEEEDQ